MHGVFSQGHVVSKHTLQQRQTQRDAEIPMFCHLCTGNIAGAHNTLFSLSMASKRALHAAVTAA